MIRSRLDPVARRVGLYTAYTLDESERVGRVSDPDMLRSLGFEPTPTLAGIPLEAAKYHPETGETHDLSLRRVDRTDETRQYHVHVFGHEVFSHSELRPDPKPIGDETVRDMVSRLRTHYRPGETYIEGDTPDLGFSGI